jgi:hypothetical protein
MHPARCFCASHGHKQGKKGVGRPVPGPFEEDKFEEAPFGGEEVCEGDWAAILLSLVPPPSLGAGSSLL